MKGVNEHLIYRPDIDGLRAIAVILVLAFHAFPKSVPSGYIGVDIFFVISGYLITNIIYGKLCRNTFSYIEFYAKRCRRILPALFLVLITVWQIGRLCLLPSDFESLGKDIFAGATFTSNLFFWYETGYFDSASELKPLLHLWSLGVEEHFYLIWPVLLAFIYKSKKNIFALLLLLFAISLYINVFMSSRDSSFAFYLLPARLWELIIGCTLSFSEQSGAFSLLKQRSSKHIISACALLMLVIGMLKIHSQIDNHIYWILLPTISTLLFIFAGPKALVNRYLLSNKAFVKIGLISYPLYLWHWPLLSFLRIRYTSGLPTKMIILTLFFSVILAWLTWKLIEKPLQQKTQPLASKSDKRWARYVACGIIGIVFIANLGWYTKRGQMFSQQQLIVSKILGAYDKIDYSTAFREGHCFLSKARFTAKSFHSNCFTPTTQDSILIWGDSFSAHFYSGLKKVIGKKTSILQLNTSCPPILGFHNPSNEHCEENNQFVFSKILQIKPKVILMSANWINYIDQNDFFEKLDNTLKTIKSSRIDTTIILIGQLPLWLNDLPKTIALNYIQHAKSIPTHSSIGLNDRSRDVNDKIRHHFERNHLANVIFVPLYDQLCNENGCLITVGTNLKTDLMSFDTGHLTPSASTYIAEKVFKPIFNNILMSSKHREIKHIG